MQNSRLLLQILWGEYKKIKNVKKIVKKRGKKKLIGE